MIDSLFRQVESALFCQTIDKKVIKTQAIYQKHKDLSLDKTNTVISAQTPGIPNKPKLVDFSAVPKRKNSKQGLIHTIHAIAHIEFNAINIALDAIYRFQDMPKQYYDDWLKVAYEESIHFGLLSDFLQSLGYQYGDFDAHNGLWEMCIKTEHSILERMALVPRVLEARGLDASPSIIQKFKKSSEKYAEFLPMLAILEQIFNDEIGHVKIGNYWFNYLCQAQHLDPIVIFDNLIKTHIGKPLRGGFNIKARKQAGFSQAELDYLCQGSTNI